MTFKHIILKTKFVILKPDLANRPIKEKVSIVFKLGNVFPDVNPRCFPTPKKVYNVKTPNLPRSNVAEESYISKTAKNTPQTMPHAVPQFVLTRARSSWFLPLTRPPFFVGRDGRHFDIHKR
ncbi:hypothetical protein GWI33_002431 [Rhynchophorus ferrugineus]|uniref:Uncharacterized protein n=1 Tax=Rhynchophorus ferrugineus TaxID=354439 RepID=A0A834ITQ0_RHYFE|nr:hypothetical protein GWI33_002431 [Rhynchophorus ferrugineus]